VGGFFVPGLGLASEATGIAAHNIQTNLLNQSGRVSLGYLHDAGYDIRQARLAWWTLASKPKKTLVWSNDFDASASSTPATAASPLATK
jgi:hypothetical protein